MSQREDLIAILERSRAKLMAQLNEIALHRKIYPLWTIREMLAHLSGWDDAVIVFIQSIMAGQIPATPAAGGLDVYNAESMATREGMDFDRIYHEFIETREVLLKLIQDIPDEKITAHYILPWGEPGTLADIVDIWGSHEEEHAEDIEKIIIQNRNEIETGHAPMDKPPSMEAGKLPEEL
jgi:hypothetical protein